MRLNGKSAIITGAARGIGYAIADRFVDEGIKVVIADIDHEAGNAAATRLGGEDKNVFFVKCDVADKLSVQRTVKSAMEQFDQIDILVNNAGIVYASDFLDLKEEDFDKVLSINLKGAFLMSQAVAKVMVTAVEEDRSPGTIINMTSINALVTIDNQLPYAVSKGGLNQLTRTMALALAPHGIRVNAIGPGSINTEMLASVLSQNPDAKTKMLARTPIGRPGEPSEIASVAAFLASEDASYITGEMIYVDGGRMTLNYTVPVKG